MNNPGAGSDVATTIRGLATGLSLSALILVQSTPTTFASSASGVVSEAASAPTVNSTSADTALVAYYSSGQGLERLPIHAGKLVPPHEAMTKFDTPPPTNLAMELKRMSGLGVVPLARIVGVSRQRYHTWLKQGGVGPDKVPHMQRLIVAFHELHAILGPDVRGFVQSRVAGTTISNLLQLGDMDTVIGLALRPSRRITPVATTSAQAREISGLPGWIRSVTRLQWQVPPVSDPEREAFSSEELAPAADADMDGQPDLPFTSQPRQILHILYEE